MRPTRLDLRRDVTAHVRRGHPWIYREALAPPTARRPHPATGEIVDILGVGGVEICRGLYDAESPIAVRVLERFPPPWPEIDAAWLGARVESACALRRARLAEIDADALRLVHGEGDSLPGLVIDLYGRTGVIRFDGDAAEAFYAPHAVAITAACERQGFPIDTLWAHPTRRRREAGGRALVGEAPTGAVIVREGPLRFEVDVVHGHKTGFFLDQRDNRRLVGARAAGLTVLDLFSYTGGFSVAAAVGGARRVTAVDLAAPAAEAARRNLERNGVAREAMEVVAEDVFDFLARARQESRRWDVVVCDPPSFAPRESARPQALAAYRRLNRLALEVVTPGGLLATASCSSHVRTTDLVAEVAAAAQEGSIQARIVARRGAGIDHPVVPGFPEGDYLSFLLVAVA